MVYPKKTKKRGPVKQYKSGRTCKKAGCKKRLSVYNANEYCYTHRGEFM